MQKNCNQGKNCIKLESTKMQKDGYCEIGLWPISLWPINANKVFDAQFNAYTTMKTVTKINALSSNVNPLRICLKCWTLYCSVRLVYL